MITLVRGKQCQPLYGLFTSHQIISLILFSNVCACYVITVPAEEDLLIYVLF